MILTIKDWLTSRKYGCQLSYEEYRELYVEKEQSIKRIVSAYMRYFMSKR